MDLKMEKILKTNNTTVLIDTASVDTTTVNQLTGMDVLSANTVPVSSEAIGSLISEAEQAAIKGNVLVITASQSVCTFIQNINPLLTKGKIAVYCDGNLYADEVLHAIERAEKELHTKNNIAYHPMHPLTLGLWALEGDRVCCMELTELPGAETLYDRTDKACGVLLPTKYKASRCLGKLSDTVRNLSLYDKAMLCRSLDGRYTAADNITVFRSDDDACIAMTTCTEAEESAVNFVWNVFSGKNINGNHDVVTAIISGITSDVPSVLLETVVMANFVDFYPENTKSVPINIKLLMDNTLERIALLNK